MPELKDYNSMHCAILIYKNRPISDKMFEFVRREMRDDRWEIEMEE
jgi:hypothetical protein